MIETANDHNCTWAKTDRLYQQPFVDSKEDQNSIGTCPVPESSIAAAKARVKAWLAPGQAGHAIFPTSSFSSSPSSTSSPPRPPSSSPDGDGDGDDDDDDDDLRICITDGFLLFGPDPPLRRLTDELFDVKFFLTVSRARATARRGARDGYVTLEGFWADPPGYVDKVVWPNYAASHAWLFEGGDVESGRGLRGEVLREKDILALPDVVVVGNASGNAEVALDVDMKVVFEWAVDTLMRKLEEIAREIRQGG